jgi:N-acetylglutamate synthase
MPFAMARPTETEIFKTVDATWAPYAFHQQDGWLIREGAGGGQRVSAATLLPGSHAPDINVAASKMRALGQNPLFMIRTSDGVLDAMLNNMGYNIVDPVAVLVAHTQSLTANPPNRAHPIRIGDDLDVNAKNIWAMGGIDQPRLDVMARVSGPKTILTAGDMGVAFAAAHNGIAMVHAVEVAKNQRRKGVAQALMYKAAGWARKQGCTWVAVLTVRANTPACTLYWQLGMKEAAAYHYRLLAAG